jgi:hypothetical protein
MFSYPILVSMACLLTSCNIQIMQNTPFNRAGRRPAPHPLLATIPSPTAIYLYLLNPLCVEYVCIMLYKSMWPFMRCEKEKESTCSICTGGPGRLLAPPIPAPLAEPGGGGEGWRAMFCLGILSGEGGSLASKVGGSFSRMDLADFHSKTFRRVILADLFGGSLWHIYLAGSPQVMQKQAVEQKKRGKRNV